MLILADALKIEMGFIGKDNTTYLEQEKRDLEILFDVSLKLTQTL